MTFADMALRLFCEYKSSKDILHRVDIFDEDYTGSSIEFNCTDTGAILQYEGQGEQMYKPTLPSRVRVGMMVKTESHESFIADIANAKEGRFVLRLTIDSAIRWTGVIVNDLAEIEDAPYPYIYEIEAVCGLGLLKKINYANGFEPIPGLVFWEEDPYTDTKSLLGHVIRALSKLGSHDADFHPDIFIHTAVNFWAEQMTFGVGNDPLYLAEVKSFAFWNIASGKYQYMSCLDVIEDICRVMGARIYYWEGWRIEQLKQRELPVVARWRAYDIDGTYLSNYANAYSLAVDQATYARMNGGKYTFYPPQRLVEVSYENRAARDLIQEQMLAAITSSPAPTVPSEGSSLISIRYVNNCIWTIEAELGAPAPNVRYWARLKTKMQVGDKWYKRSATFQSANGQQNIIYGAPEWSDTEDWFYTYFKIPAAWNNGQVKFYANVAMDTIIDTESTGAFYYEEVMEVVNFVFVPIPPSFVANVFDPTDYVKSKTQGQDAQAWLLFDGTPLQSSRFRTYETKSAYRGSEDLKFKTVLGDSIGSDVIAPLMVSGTKTTGWRFGSTGTYKPLLQLLVEAIMSANAKTTKRYKGRVYGGSLGGVHRLAWNSNGFVFMGGTFYTNVDEVEGEWYALKTDTAGTYSNGIIKIYNIDPNIPVPPSTPPAPTGVFDHEHAAPGGAAQTQPPPALEILAATALSAELVSGTATSISVEPALSAGAFPVGSIINIVNPSTGAYTQLTVAAPIENGDTTITVTGTSNNVYPVGSYIIYGTQNVTTSGGAGPSGGTAPTSYTIASAGTFDLAAGKLLSHIVLKAASGTATVSIGTAIAGTDVLDSLEVGTTATTINLSRYTDAAETIHITTTSSITLKTWII